MSTVALTAKSTFYETTILDLLSKMPYGRLNLTLPNGQVLNIGDGSGGIIANATITNSNFYKRCLLYGDIGFGEAYVEGEWETDNITNVIKWFLLNVEFTPGVSGSKTKAFVLNVLKFLNKLSHLKKANTLSQS